jgi:hypothetical protein
MFERMSQQKAKVTSRTIEIPIELVLEKTGLDVKELRSFILSPQSHSSFELFNGVINDAWRASFCKDGYLPPFPVPPRPLPKRYGLSNKVGLTVFRRSYGKVIPKRSPKLDFFRLGNEYMYIDELSNKLVVISKK